MMAALKLFPIDAEMPAPAFGALVSNESVFDGYGVSRLW
ncbi:MAG: hypothetical protein JWL61_2144 [Gemmatimonadetes bacterium]|nr:hypothetical protein [Gemmatimonadota bacterium]